MLYYIRDRAYRILSLWHLRDIQKKRSWDLIVFKMLVISGTKYISALSKPIASEVCNEWPSTLITDPNNYFSFDPPPKKSNVYFKEVINKRGACSSIRDVQRKNVHPEQRRQCDTWWMWWYTYLKYGLLSSTLQMNRLFDKEFFVQIEALLPLDFVIHFLRRAFPLE